MKIRKKKNTTHTNSYGIHGSLLNFLTFCLLLILIFLLILVGYFLYINIPRNPENLNVNFEKDGNENFQSTSEVKQFYPRMKFNHNAITYSIDTFCTQEERNRISDAFSFISSLITSLLFSHVSASDTPVDITILCNEQSEKEVNEDHFIAGEGGAREIIQTGKYHIINGGIIYLYENKNGNVLRCDEPKVEIHETMHVFGYGHSSDKDSIMYPYVEQCDQTLDSSIINELLALYNEENLPDLYFATVSAIKRGRYIDFSLTIKNSGSIDSTNITLSVIEDDVVIDEKHLGAILYGSGISINTTNLKLNKLHPAEIQFVIDAENNVKELDENNNNALVKVM